MDYYQCVRYYVDPTLLNIGVPIEELEKSDVQIFKADLKSLNFSGFRKNNNFVFKPKRKRGDSRRDG
ncbi:hypothetical protein G7B40_001315 [Aetokthonos hydrillicola Thurmond2011]|jgi:hypothetical protein|uniref:Uncharacterized protein n=1 Tax=Aetokthonos hydrillicola Thurmond2011 TaxID=2712845 RepID=A0AAP5M8F6_9CYAN|nr:hypothetical protein [Aetokthonos hydrillicola CCALA 1050]MDR9893224.1 hypothetical protein [Aetokthonos hydrillicola Thurmond2011]